MEDTNLAGQQPLGTDRKPKKPATIDQQAIDVYLISQQSDGEVRGVDWWQNANGYTAIALHEIWSGTQYNYEDLSQALRACEKRKHGFINEFNDDSLWWALCCLHVHAIRKDPWFLEKARGVWKHVRHHGICRKGQATFQGTDMEGACYWTTNPGEQQVNAIGAALFAELSIRLASIHQDLQEPNHLFRNIFKQSTVTSKGYLDAARCSVGWILRCRYRKEDSIVLDHILLKDQEAVDWTFTYTTGVTIGVCALLYEATAENEYLDLAISMAQKAMRRNSWVEDDGVLTERGAYGKDTHNPAHNNDAVGFKSVLIRHLAIFYSILAKRSNLSPEAEAVKSSIKTFIGVNSRSQQERNTNEKGQYGPWWNGPFDMPTSHSQMAVLDVMAATMLIDSA